MQINRLWTAMLTRESRDSETDSSIHVSVNTNGVERLNHTFSDTQQTDQERGIANLYDVDVTDNGIQSEQLTDSSIRLGINGDDAWRPQHVFVFGEGVTRPGVNETQAVPIETETDTTLCTDPTQAPSSAPFPLLPHASGTLPI